jgi:exopolysaccharide production protein ExoZ
MRERLDGLQAGRGFAAVAVLLCHSEYVTESLNGISLTGGLFRFGRAGVDFFFVLSGFVLYWAHRQDFGRPDRLGRFAWKRFRRVYPPYWVVLALVIAGLWLLPSATPPPGLGQAAAAALLVPHPAGPVLQVAWTLSYEVAFYLLLGLAILHRPLGFALLGLWLLVSLVAPLLDGVPDFFAAPYPAHFILGMAAARLAPLLAVRTARLVLAAGGVALLVVAAIFGGSPGTAAAWCWALASAVTLVGLARAELRWPRFTLLLGDASYSIYLVHVPALILAARIEPKLTGSVDQLTIMVAALAVGILYHLLCERPLLRGMPIARRTWLRMGVGGTAPR